MIEKKVDKEGVILHVKSNVIVKLENMLNGLEYLKKDKTLPRNLRIFEDATNAEVAFNINDIDILIEKMHEVVQEYNTIRHAVLHDSPKSTAFAMIIERKKIDTNYMLKIFSTTYAAFKWLNNK
jgi:hypothetical protein